MSTLSDSSADFADATGTEHLHVRGELWWVAGDPAGQIFYESHPGPHRVEDQTWTRTGDRYVLSSSSVEPSAYNTLVSFIYRLSTGDDGWAAQLMADTSLLDAAKRLGLAQRAARSAVGDESRCQYGVLRADPHPQWPALARRPAAACRRDVRAARR